ncbi:MAG: phage portal protein, partial [Ferrovibrio sp.]
MAETLGFDVAARAACRTWEEALRLFIAQADAAGVLVMVSGVVLSNNRRTLAMAMDRHAGRLFTRGGRPSGVLQFAKGMAEDAVKKSRAAWRATHENEDSGGQTAILYDGATFVPLSFSSTDSQFLENRRFQIEEIARAFNIPAPMVGDLSRATWSNSEQKGREFLSYTLEPWLRGLEGALGRGHCMAVRQP